MTARIALLLCLFGFACPTFALAQDDEATPSPAPIQPIAKAIPVEEESSEKEMADGETGDSDPAKESTSESSEADIPAEPERARAYTSPPADDPSFFLMGEFLGSVNRNNALGTSNSPEDQMGLQLRPIGESDFDALSFSGGLPGEGGKLDDTMRLVGRRAGEAVVLSGASIRSSAGDSIPVALFVDPSGCSVIDSSGKLLGRLDKITRKSRTLGATPPEGAVVLFDGTDTSLLNNATVTDEGLLAEGFSIKPMIQDFDLHIEFMTPYMPDFDEQKRGNSGVYIHSRYECQVLDSFAQDPKYNGLGAIYTVRAPDVNMAFAPLVWQTYDIRFTAPRYNSDGTKFSNARITSWVNGVKVQDDITIEAPTGYGKPEEPVMLPVLLQNHGDPVRFRNMWMIDRGLMQVEFPVEKSEDAGEQDQVEAEPVTESEGILPAPR
ncbi:hypothetical protein Pla22_32490 [Rubripirellula amarantea]|uniref:3-keto-alpha-glucoside-1,2-lyase/3-keto-2-hydroxy-glucal hydratase domain-containing protein n=1 Tax=Rubripirellula amarantea TaxID=2527999 RepID=A0A5C5WI78_9BACT|nr:DUF1080 domain-containing protein [Rubripirellula amarantea]TWT50506.1 hypothetical protein Pla22_32490 [Rubripirellula amarantea]